MSGGNLAMMDTQDDGLNITQLKEIILSSAPEVSSAPSQYQCLSSAMLR